MNNRVELMLEKSQNDNVVYARALLLPANIIPVFFEGEDEKYYYPRVTFVLENNWKGFNCGGKKKVIDVFEAMKNNENESVRNRIALYFIDADFDDNTELAQYDNIYITPCYSIENFYCTLECFEAIVRNELKCGDDFIVTLKDYYEELICNFLTAIFDFNKLYYALKNKNCGSLNINNINIDQILKVTFTKKEVEKDYDHTQPQTLFREINLPDAYNHDNEPFPLSEASVYYEKLAIFRGKTTFKFFIKTLNFIAGQESLNYFKSINNNTSYKLTRFSYEEALSRLSGYAETPNCLKNFLERYKPNVA